MVIPDHSLTHLLTYSRSGSGQSGGVFPGKSIMAESQFKLDEFELYQAARQFRKKVYKLILELPAEEKYCQDPQMRRAAASVTNNIAEGHGRWHYLENSHFCQIARGSVDELIDDINICLDEGYGDAGENDRLKTEAYALIGRINSYILYLKKTKQGAKSGE